MEEICAGGFVVREGKVLAMRRWNGAWLPPKGHVDPGETLAEAAQREVQEETGLTARVVERLGETAYSHREDGRRHKKRVHWFLMAAEPGEVRPEEGMFIAHRWVKPTELATFTFKHDRKLARRALAIALGGKVSEKDDRD